MIGAGEEKREELNWGSEGLKQERRVEVGVFSLSAECRWI